MSGQPQRQGRLRTFGPTGGLVFNVVAQDAALLGDVRQRAQLCGGLRTVQVQQGFFRRITGEPAGPVTRAA